MSKLIYLCTLNTAELSMDNTHSQQLPAAANCPNCSCHKSDSVYNSLEHKSEYNSHRQQTDLMTQSSSDCQQPLTSSILTTTSIWSSGSVCSHPDPDISQHPQSDLGPRPVCVGQDHLQHKQLIHQTQQLQPHDKVLHWLTSNTDCPQPTSQPSHLQSTIPRRLRKRHNAVSNLHTVTPGAESELDSGIELSTDACHIYNSTQITDSHTTQHKPKRLFMELSPIKKTSSHRLNLHRKKCATNMKRKMTLKSRICHIPVGGSTDSHMDKIIHNVSLDSDISQVLQKTLKKPAVTVSPQTTIHNPRSVAKNLKKMGKFLHQIGSPQVTVRTLALL